MKKPILIALLITVVSYTYGQLTLGIKGGVNFSNVIYKSDTAKWDSYGVAPSFHVGGYGRIKVTELISLSTELLVSDKGFRENGSAFLSKSHLLYANVPVLANFQIIPKLGLELGPEFGLLIASWGKHKEYLSAIYKNRFDLGVVAGLQYTVAPTIGMTLRVEQGLTNMVGRNVTASQYNYGTGADPVIVGQNLREQGVVHRNRNIQLSVCYTIFNK